MDKWIDRFIVLLLLVLMVWAPLSGYYTYKHNKEIADQKGLMLEIATLTLQHQIDYIVLQEEATANRDAIVEMVRVLFDGDTEFSL